MRRPYWRLIGRNASLSCSSEDWCVCVCVCVYVYKLCVCVCVYVYKLCPNEPTNGVLTP